jgi:hypothetical protein
MIKIWSLRGAVITAVLLCASVALMRCAGAADYYLSQTGSGTFSGNSQANAATGWTTASIETAVGAGDSVWVCGAVSSNSTFFLSENGTSAQHITVRGDCPGNPGSLNGNGVAQPVLSFGEPAQDASYLDLKNITVENGAQTPGGYLFIITSNGSQIGFNVVQDVILRNGGYVCLALQKHSITVNRANISGCGEDAIYAGNTTVGGIYISNSTITNFSTIGVNGDAIQVYNADGDVTISNNTIKWPTTTAAIKQAIIVGATAGLTSIVNNKIINNGNRLTVNHGISCTSGRCLLIANYVKGFNAAFTYFTDPAATALTFFIMRGNVVENSKYGFTANSADDFNVPMQILNNSFVNVEECAEFFADLNQVTYRNNNCYYTGTASAGWRLKIGSTNTSYLGGNNLMYPDGETNQYSNNICGGNFSTVATYIAGCSSEAGSLGSNPTLSGDTTPTTPEGFRPTAASPLCNAAFKAPPIAGVDYFGKRFGPSPTIGAVMCN